MVSPAFCPMPIDACGTGTVETTTGTAVHMFAVAVAARKSWEQLPLHMDLLHKMTAHHRRPGVDLQTAGTGAAGIAAVPGLVGIVGDRLLVELHLLQWLIDDG